MTVLSPQWLPLIARHRQVSLMLESGTTMQDIKGIMIQGHATVYTDAENTLRLSREGARLRGVPEYALPREPRPGVAYIKVEPRRCISWDYGKDTASTA